LRELTLWEIAEEVDEDLSKYMEKEGILDNWGTVERIMVCISQSIFVEVQDSQTGTNANSMW